MKRPSTAIAYLDAPRLLRALSAGIGHVFQRREYLNRINVFPVPDGDTGTNLALTVQAIADHLKAIGDADKGVVIGYDARFMGDAFAHETARILAGSGIKAFVCNRDTPTPTIAYEVIRRGAGGGAAGEPAVEVVNSYLVDNQTPATGSTPLPTDEAASSP